MNNREIINKNVRIANDLEIQKICTKVANTIKEDSLRVFKDNLNEEEILEDYLSFKNSILYGVRFDIEFNTKEKFTFFDIIVSDGIWYKEKNDKFSMLRFSYELENEKLKEVDLEKILL